MSSKHINLEHINHELENYSDREIETEYDYRKLGDPHSDEINILAFTSQVLMQELVRRGYKMPDHNIAKIVEGAVSLDRNLLSESVRNFIYNQTGRFFKVDIA